MEFEKTWIIMENKWNFVKYDKPPVARKLAVGHTSFLATGGFKY